MILVCGILADGLIELMCARLKDMQLDYLLLDERSFPGDYDISWELDQKGVSGFVTTPNRRVALNDITGVYARYVDYEGDSVETDLSEAERIYAQAECQSSLMQLLDILPCPVVNRVSASASNDSKIYQGMLANSFGLRTPKTLVTTSKESAINFYEECDKKVIFKSLSSVRSIVRPMDERDFDRLELLKNGPTQFQERIDGVDYRVHTIGGEVFPTEIRSDAGDYRYARREGKSASLEAATLPDSVAQSCIGMSKQLGLELAGVDLRRTPQDEWVCFEVNPSPGFLYYEVSTGQPISRAVANRLRGN